MNNSPPAPSLVKRGGDYLGPLKTLDSRQCNPRGWNFPIRRETVGRPKDRETLAFAARSEYLIQ